MNYIGLPTELRYRQVLPRSLISSPSSLHFLLSPAPLSQWLRTGPNDTTSSLRVIPNQMLALPKSSWGLLV
ncbi:hypothetical protein PAXRUDRAFT_823993 [Paxillus rubicundulus Ve08.2h10]|uniref:Uncharacterized protein n=1 Tax=Paxillus rubicundulus Ve08.2h10 TaxID=930991 RepID=A0A0D0E2M9_9AGAM|nr:hypothetical protein PAXRUDRAFT_823993 [Paxillus rubicundulus Ve08.2h10]